MSLEQPKKVAGGAFGRYMNAHRAELLKETAGKPASESTKLGSERFKALSATERAKYDKMYEDAKAQYEKDMAAFLAAGGEKAAIVRKSKDKDADGAKKKKDPDAPKRPAGGGYGIYVNEHREEIVKSLPADHKITDVTKAAGARWKALTDAQRKPYEDKYHAKNEEYKKAMEEYKASHPEPVVEEMAQSPPAKDGKRKANDDSTKKATPAKKTKMSKGASKQPEVDIDEAVLAQARKANLEGALKNLANRPEIVAAGLKADKMLSALKNCDGLVNPAKRALLGA